jgi:hypothetical protein
VCRYVVDPVDAGEAEPEAGRHPIHPDQRPTTNWIGSRDSRRTLRETIVNGFESRNKLRVELRL